MVYLDCSLAPLYWASLKLFTFSRFVVFSFLRRRKIRRKFQISENNQNTIWVVPIHTLGIQVSFEQIHIQSYQFIQAIWTYLEHIYDWYDFIRLFFWQHREMELLSVPLSAELSVDFGTETKRERNLPLESSTIRNLWLD